MGEAIVRRSHALLLMIFTGFSARRSSSSSPPRPTRCRRLAADRAELTRFCLDLVEATKPA